MDIQGFIKLARATAKSHNLPEDLVCAVCDHESGGWNTWALRYEPLFYERYVRPQKGLTETEAMARAFSYGLMQIMGQTAREFGFKGKYLTELCDPAVGTAYGCYKLKRCLELSKGDVRSALLKYNGGGNTSYPDKVLALLPKYKL